MKNLNNEISILEKRVIEVFSLAVKVKLNYKQVSAKLNIFDKTGKEKIKEVINSFVDAGVLFHSGRGKYHLNPKYLNQKSTGRNYVTGILQVVSSGLGFVILDDPESEDILISEHNMGNALPNDKVKVLLLPAGRRRGQEGEIVEIVERSKKQLVGVIRISKGVAYFIPDSPSFKRDVLIPGRMLKGAKSGDKVVVVISDWVTGTRSPLGEVVHLLGKPGDNNVEMNSILAEYNFPLAFPDAVEKEAAKISSSISKEEINKRRDFRTTTTFTIDPADAKDFDDAISYQKLKSGLHQVGIHIADVSFYVKPGSLIDQEAYNRGTSIYLVDRTIPMLPETLSNNLCSLRPHEDKLCFSAVFELDDHAKIHKEWFGRTVINSDRRLSYEEAQEIIVTREGDFNEFLLPVHELAQIIRKERMASNAINFETEEVKFHLDENGKPTGVYFKIQKEANFLIEEFMLLANKRVAEKIGKKTTPNKEIKTFVYRVHDKPIEDKLETFKTFVKKLGFDLKTGSRKALATSFNNMFKEAHEKGNFDMLTKLSIRLMARAVYSTNNIGHYGLAFPYYTHFTSPIRRYPDLMVHRLFDGYLRQQPSVNKDEYEEYCKHSSKMEQLATEAERSSVKYKQAEFLSDKIGQVFQATINGISKWGIFAEIDDFKCEGMIPIRKFDDDFYYIDDDNYALVGLHHGKTLRFGDKIMIKISSVDMAKKQITFDYEKN